MQHAEKRPRIARRSAILSLILLAFASPVPAQTPKAAPSPTSDPASAAIKAEQGYALGVVMGRLLREQGVAVDPDALAKGLKEGLTGAKPSVDESRLQATLLKFQQDLTQKQKAINDLFIQRQEELGQAFLAANARRPNVQTRPSGLQYRIDHQGAGAVPKPTDTVRVHYRGSLVNNAIFDDTFEDGAPMTIAVADMLDGWAEAMSIMKVGSRFHLYVPAKLAYGDSPPPGGLIPPNATLIYEIELVGIEPPQPAPARRP